MRTFGGLDWASETHAVCVVDEHGHRRWERFVAHDESAIAELCRRLIALDVQRVAIERPDGIVVERLLHAGIAVVAIHPNQVKAARDRYTVTGGKSDRLDAFVLAELARTDMHRFRFVTPDTDQTKALRALTRSREDLVEVRVQLANQLRAQLDACWPGATRIFADIDSPIALAFLARYPGPRDARRLRQRRLHAFLDRQHYSGRRTATDLLDRLRSAPAGTAAEHELAARRDIVLGLVAALQPIVDQIAALTSQIRRALHAHPDGQLFQSFFRDPKTIITPATLLAEIGDNRARYPTARALAADAGMTPVAIESGKRKTATFRRACDKRLRHAISTLADSTRHHHPWAHDTYQRATSRGHDHPRAIRTLGDAWTRILWACWHHHQPYDPARHGNLTRLLQDQG